MILTHILHNLVCYKYVKLNSITVYRVHTVNYDKKGLFQSIIAEY